MQVASSSAAPFVDWLGIHLPIEHLQPEHAAQFESALWKVLFVDGDGRVRRTDHKPRSLRSDDSRIIVGIYGNDKRAISLGGSPARIGQSNNVFGSSDVADCARRMIDTASAALGIPLPKDLALYRPHRIDVTENYFLPSADAALEVMDALIDKCPNEGTKRIGRTLYWKRGTEYVDLKGYPKGPQLRAQVRSGDAKATADELNIADHLIRLEASLGPKFLRRLPGPWHSLTPADLLRVHREQFSKVMPRKLLGQTNSIASALLGPDATTRKLGDFVRELHADGLERVRERYSRTTWHRRVKALEAYGLAPSDVVHWRAGAASLDFDLDAPVRSWDECRARIATGAEACAAKSPAVRDRMPSLSRAKLLPPPSCSANPPHHRVPCIP